MNELGFTSIMLLAYKTFLLMTASSRGGGTKILIVTHIPRSDSTIIRFSEDEWSDRLKGACSSDDINEVMRCGARHRNVKKS